MGRVGSRMSTSLAVRFSKSSSADRATICSRYFPITRSPSAMMRSSRLWAAMTWNFMLNRHITFKGPTGLHPIAEYVRFCSACLLGAEMNWSASIGLIYSTIFFGHHPLGAVILGTGIAAVTNYSLCRAWVFRKPTIALRTGEANQTPHRPLADCVLIPGGSDSTEGEDQIRRAG